MKRRFLPIALAVGLLLLASCQPATTAPPPTSQPTHTPLPSPSATVAASATSAPTVTATATPVVPLAQTGPWLALSSRDSLWVANPDGNGLYRLIGGSDLYRFSHFAIAPHGGRIVFQGPATSPFSANVDLPSLILVTLPDLTSHSIAPLFSGTALPTSTEYENNPNEDVFGAVYDARSLAWSPDGKMLAYVSAQFSSSADLYVFSTADNSIRQLTSGPTQTIDLSWSPDGHYIVSIGALSMNYEKGGADGPTPGSIWAVRPDGSDLRLVYSFDGNQAIQWRPLGWISGRSFVEVYGKPLGCGDYQLNFVDILGPSTYKLISSPSLSAALDPLSGILLVSAPDAADRNLLAFCGGSASPGVSLISVYGNTPATSIPLPGIIAVSWSSEAQLFFAFTEEAVFTIDLKGHVNQTDVPGPFNAAYADVLGNQPIVSPNGQEWAFYDSGNQGIWIASPDHDTLKIYTEDVGDIEWLSDGSGILFTSGANLHRALGPQYSPEILEGPIAGIDQYDQVEISWIMP